MDIIREVLSQKLRWNLGLTDFFGVFFFIFWVSGLFWMSGLFLVSVTFIVVRICLVSGYVRVLVSMLCTCACVHVAYV